MADVVAEFDAGKIMNTIDVKVKLTGLSRLAVRLHIAQWLFTLATRIAGCKGCVVEFHQHD